MNADGCAYDAHSNVDDDHVKLLLRSLDEIDQETGSREVSTIGERFVTAGAIVDCRWRRETVR